MEKLKAQTPENCINLAIKHREDRKINTNFSKQFIQHS
jgi:hypothetical protein